MIDISIENYFKNKFFFSSFRIQHFLFIYLHLYMTFFFIHPLLSDQLRRQKRANLGPRSVEGQGANQSPRGQGQGVNDQSQEANLKTNGQDQEANPEARGQEVSPGAKIQGHTTRVNVRGHGTEADGHDQGHVTKGGGQVTSNTT